MGDQAWAVVASAAISAGITGFVTYKVTSRSITESRREGREQRDHDSNHRGLDRETQLRAAVVSEQFNSRWRAYVLVQTELRQMQVDAYGMRKSVFNGSYIELPPWDRANEDQYAEVDLAFSDDVRDGYITFRDSEKKVRECYQQCRATQAAMTPGDGSLIAANDAFRSADNALKQAITDLTNLLRAELDPRRT